MERVVVNIASPFIKPQSFPDILLQIRKLSMQRRVTNLVIVKGHGRLANKMKLKVAISGNLITAIAISELPRA
jgi:hypothetical protein